MLFACFDEIAGNIMKIIKSYNQPDPKLKASTHQRYHFERIMSLEEFGYYVPKSIMERDNAKLMLFLKNKELREHDRN